MTQAEQRTWRRPPVVACIPAYDEERTIARVVLKTKKYVGRVVVCDDGSVDLTGAIAEFFHARLGGVLEHRVELGGVCVSSP